MFKNHFPMSFNETLLYFKEFNNKFEAQLELMSKLLQNIDDVDRNINSNMYKYNEENTSEILNICKSISEIKKNLEQFTNTQNSINSDVIAKLDSICSAIYNKEMPLDVRFEREYYKNFPTDSSAKYINFYKDFSMLVNGLDRKSIENICLAFKRLNIVQNTSDPFMALYSFEEKEKIRHIYEHFLSGVTQISENCFYCAGYKLPINHFESTVFVDKCCIGELEYPERILDCDIIDAGGYIGDSALIFSDYTRKTVHAFEPVPQNFNYMLQTIKLNSAERILPQQYALGEEVGKTSIFINDSGSTQFENSAFDYQGNVEVDMITLDEYVKKNNLKIGLIKADIEGSEQFMLRGAMETIKNQKPALLISIYHNADDFFHIKPMIESWNLGYKFKIIHPVCGSILTETMLIAEVY